MKLHIFENELDASEFTTIEYECLLREWLSIREQYRQARLYKDAICVQNDVTPKTKDEALKLLDVDGDYFVVCHAKAPAVWAIAAAVISVGMAVYTYLNMPKIDAAQDSSGSGNNSLANRQNKHRTNQRVPDIYGTVKSIPDLIAPPYRYYKDNVQTEECLMCIGNGYFEINPTKIKEAETPMETIEGASLGIYEPNTSLVGAPQIQIGEVFNEYPLVAKQVAAIDGRQKLISPNSSEVEYDGIAFISNAISVKGDPQYYDDVYIWNGVLDQWRIERLNRYADFTKYFNDGEQVIIQNANFGNITDEILSGTVDVSISGVLTIATNQVISNVNAFKKIRIQSLLIEDVTNGALDLAGEYNVTSIAKSGSVYTVTLAQNFAEINPSFTFLTGSGVGIVSSILTDNDNNIDLSGTYTIATVTAHEVTLVNPSAVNADWNRLGELTAQQISAFLSKKIKFKGTSDNWIGWYYAGNSETEGFILNFAAENGIYEGDRAKQVALEVQYQPIVDGEPSGIIKTVGLVMDGKANNRNKIGATIKQAIASVGPFRFRARRVNDNGNNANLIDDVTFESAYSYHSSEHTYNDATVLRLKRLAIGSGTNASELNMIVTRKLYSYRGGVRSSSRIATKSFADIAINIALDQNIGRMSLDELDIQSFYDVEAEMLQYFGFDEATHFNYTFDDTNQSYQEMIFTIAEAVFCTARRENGSHFFVLERENPNSNLLFNHRNTAPDSITVSDSFGIIDDYDGIEFKWRDASDNYIEKSIKLPDDLQPNYKTIDSVGVTSADQAHIHAWRAWNKLKYSCKTIEFTAYGEADLVTRKDRIAVVDTTLPVVIAGEIEEQNNTVLTLDHPIDLDGNLDYVIHLQLKSGLVDVIPIVAQTDDYQIKIERIPLVPLVTNGVVHATYSITVDVDVESEAYIIEEKSQSSTSESTIRATKYDSRFYQNDKNFLM